MIKLTGMNNREFYLNAEHIEKIEQVPETVITLTNDRKYLVLEDADEVIKSIYNYKREIFRFGL